MKLERYVAALLGSSCAVTFSPVWSPVPCEHMEAGEGHHFKHKHQDAVSVSSITVNSFNSGSE
jgi:hypothetical protein